MSNIILPEQSHIYSQLQNLVQSCEMVLFSGLPGVGKSLLLQQTALMAQQFNRKVHLLQLDIIRPAFESDDILEKYPETNSITHASILRAVGIWTRSAIRKWHQYYRNSDHILIGEAPLIGGRMMELARPDNDDLEPIIRSDKTQFVVPVPTREVRRTIVGKREKTIVAPQHEKENLDAPPNVLQAMWQNMYKIAHELGFAETQLDNAPYSPDIYRAVYGHLLRYRNSIPLIISEVFEPAGSVYVLGNVEAELVPTPGEVKQVITQIEQDFTQEQIEAQVRYWYRI